MSNEVELGLNLYEANKQLMNNIKPLDPILLNRAVSDVAKEMNDGKYFMLLNKELSDYTVFYITERTTVSHMVKEIVETLETRGKVLSIDKLNNFDWEIWIRDDSNENFYYRLFNCNDFIVEV